MKFLKFIAVAVAALAMVACGDKPGGTVTEKSPFRMEVGNSFVQIGVDHAYFLVYLDDQLLDPADLTFYDENDEEVAMGTYEVEVDGAMVTVPEWVPTQPETKSFWVAYKSYYTKELVSVTAVTFSLPDRLADPQPDNVSFVKRTFFTQFTGAGCGYCPYAKAALYEASADEEYADKFVVAAIYTYDSREPMYPKNNGNIATAFGVSSYPAVFYDIKGRFSHEMKHSDYNNVKAAINDSLSEDAKAGISVSVASDEGNTFVARVSVKAAVDGEFYVGLWLVEDGIEYDQSDYGCLYDDNNGLNFDIHNNVLRLADSGTKYYGRPLGAMKAGEVKDDVFAMTIDTSGKKPWVKENCRLVAFVASKVGNSAFVTNVVTNEVFSESIEFEYK